MTRTVSSEWRLSIFTPFSTVLDGLNEGGLLEGDIVRNRDHTAARGHPIHHANILREAAAGRFEASCNADFFIEGALSRGAFAAIEALAAGNVMVDDDAFASLGSG